MKQPENVRRVLEMVRDQGLRRTLDRVMGKLAAGSATGYSAAGVVVDTGGEVEGFEPGQYVACAGAGIANHAELIDVPINLAVRLPVGLDAGLASTVTLGAIALQSVRRAAPTLGETFVVVGLGVLGQIAAQLLCANGCRVIGVDPNPHRLALALENGMDGSVDPAAENYVDYVMRATQGMGADGVVVTAAAESHQIISEALQACRKKGRVVLVGDVGLNLKRADLYRKELDFLISTSYGPGRYDPAYEEGGQDYPLAYVRWTENRNMQAYLDLLARGRIRLGNLAARTYPIDEAAAAFQSLQAAADRPLLVLLEYPERPGVRATRVALRSTAPRSGTLRVALAGASGFAQGMHLPNMVKLRDRYCLRAVMSRTGANARAVATQYGAAYCTTEYGEILADPEVDLVMIATRHNLHAELVVQALRAGKHVFVEKPLALNEAELARIEAFYAGQPDGPLLMVGFNRRFSPALLAVQRILAGRTSPIIANYRMNAGYIPAEHWVHGPEGGGRNIGEACHVYDAFNFLTGGAAVEQVDAQAIGAGADPWRRNDNFVATMRYSDGSLCTLTYTALGSKSYAKEKLEIFADGKVVVMDDYKSVSVHGANHRGWLSQASDKGQLQELEALAEALKHGRPWPISLAAMLQSTRVSFAVEQRMGGAPC
ncbi:MAG: bi-domain-containing oxidoreductase [Rhodocyclaceae bacterium]|nr:bi-domain-containing oxidoreductase [Rhodocyclaceae bacterium]MBX3667282.1 bi-domain-containing oxidoreductase [Rhodocyclaceae bacterium]